MFRVEPRNVVRRGRDIALSLFDDGAASSGENATDVPVVLMAAQEGNLFSKFLETKPIIFLGEISFSIYMMHWIVIQIFNWLSDHGMVWNWFLLKTVTLLTVLGLSIGTYQFIELPARKWGRYLARVPRPTPVEAATG